MGALRKGMRVALAGAERGMASMQQRLTTDFNISDSEAVAALKGGFVGGLNVYSIQEEVNGRRERRLLDGRITVAVYSIQEGVSEKGERIFYDYSYFCFLLSV